tara:strand:+ start:569 stop:1558 length:990 start_codon:yes stop_codon:yes gene_type:complete
MPKNKNVLVTGGAGYIGSHTCKILKSNNFNPVSYDNLSSGKKKFVKWGPLVIGELGDKNKIIKTIKKYKIEAIIHLAAKSIVEDSELNKNSYFINNLHGTITLLEAMRECKIKKIIFSSTAAVYGESTTFKIKESHKLSPINIYGLTKLMCENFIKTMKQIDHLDYIILRYFNASGSDYISNIGELHDPETHLIPKLSIAFCLKTNFYIYGNNYKTQDGTCIRDFIHVLDIAEAHVISLKHILKNNIAETYNLGTGEGYSIKKIINIFEEITKTKIKIKYAKERINDPRKLVADPKKFNLKFNWKARKSSLHKIIYSELAWRKKQLKIK